MRSLSLFALSPLLPTALAWGTLGHQTVTLIATHYLHPHTLKFAQQLLNDTSSTALAAVATWPDSYRYVAGGEFSAPFHYIDANDNPPKYCGIVYERDCHDGDVQACIISAVGNYTQRVQDKKLPTSEREIALKFLLHFLGDMHQPLHTEALAIGGNTINVLFGNTTTNLHRVWDSSIPEKLVGGYNLSYSQTWAKKLIKGIKNKEAQDWVRGTDLKDPIRSSLKWAGEANQEVCNTVLRDGVAAVENKELSGKYYERAVPVVEELVSKGGVRLAAWLNLIVTGKTGFGGHWRRDLGAVEMEEREAVPVEWDVEMVAENRRRRREAGWDCGCGEEHEGHAH